MSSFKLSQLFFVFIGLLILSCKSGSSDQSGEGMLNLPLKQKQVEGLFEYVDASQSGLAFVNNMPDSLTSYIFKYEYAVNGGCVAIGGSNN